MEYRIDHWQTIGHTWAVEQLVTALNRGRSRHAYLLSGPPSIGKTTLARDLAMALNCLSDEVRPCGECRACTLIAKGSHPDVTYVEADRVGGTLKIDQIRDLQHILYLRPYEGRHRVAIIQRFQEAHVAAANALLKTLEEPPNNVVIILATDHLQATLPTILSRCQHLPLRPLPIHLVETVLRQQVDPDSAALWARLSAGRIGWAMQVFADPEVLARRNEAISLLEDLLSESRRTRFKAAEELQKDKSALLEILQLWQTYWRDALLMAAGSEQWIINVDRHDPQKRNKMLDHLAGQFPPEVHRQALEATRRTINYLHRNVNTKLALEVLFLDYPFMPAAG
jgi:DNA polymerase-3 subunit delta'